MQSGTCGKYTFHKRVGSETTFVFDYSHYLGTADGMLHTYPNPGDFRVEVLLPGREFLSLAFLNGLYDCYPLQERSPDIRYPDTRYMVKTRKNNLKLFTNNHQ